MHLRSILLREPQRLVSRKRLTIGMVGATVLAVMVLAHAVALGIFEWEQAASPRGAVGLAFLWVVCLLAIVLLVRFLLHALRLWRREAEAKP